MSDELRDPGDNVDPDGDVSCGGVVMDGEMVDVGGRNEEDDG